MRISTDVIRFRQRPPGARLFGRVPDSERSTTCIWTLTTRRRRTWRFFERPTRTRCSWGRPRAVDAALATLQSGLRQPVVAWTPAETPEPPALTAGTLIVRDLADLERRAAAAISRLGGPRTSRRPGHLDQRPAHVVARRTRRVSDAALLQARRGMRRLDRRSRRPELHVTRASGQRGRPASTGVVCSGGSSAEASFSDTKRVHCRTAPASCA